jgi:ATP-dependent Clp protease ATP-binding subunit ClpA
VLLAACEQPNDVLQQTFEQLEVKLELVKHQIRLALQNSSQPHHPLSLPEVSKQMNVVVAAALAEAKALGDSQISTEHFILGILKNAEIPSAKVLAGCHIKYENFRQVLAELKKDTQEDAEL